MNLARVRLSADGATQKKLIGYANYQPVGSELLPLELNGMPHSALPVSNPLVTRHEPVASDSASQSPIYFSFLVTAVRHRLFQPSMMSEQILNIKFLGEVEKHPVLYNYMLLGYYEYSAADVFFEI